MPTVVNRLLRTPWGFPLVVSVALAGVAVNESVHRSTRQGLTGSVQADQVSRHAAEANYYALDRVNVLRAHLLQPHAQWVTRYQDANVHLERSIGFIVDFLRRWSTSGQEDAARLAGLYAARSADLARAFDHARAGRPGEALAALRDSDSAGRGVALRAELLKAVERARGHGAGADARVLAAIDAMRWLMHALIVAMVLATYVLLRQTQQIDAVRRQQADLLSREVAARTADLRELAGHLITTREDERGRLARELHDEMGGLLSTLKLDMARLRRNKDLPGSVREHTEAIDRRLSEVVELKRQVIENLRPSALDHLGLTQALALLCQDNASVMEVPTHHDLEPVRLSPELELTVYRVVQEALTNVRKYSHASTVWVSLRTLGDQVHLTVEDDGVGFDAAHVGPGHHGLAGMRLRIESHAGRFDVGTRPDGRGSKLHAVLPLTRPSAESA